MKNLSAFILLLTMWFATTSLRAQEYPVQVTTILTPPYSLYLSDYASPEANALQLIINLRELDRFEYRVKLRVTIEGQGISLRTKPSYVPPALVLQGGVPEILTGPDLSGYLNPDNLDFSGISKQEFVKKGTFPEGFYTFRIEVVDYVRNVVVSNAGLANAWIILNDPPIINLPFNGEKVIANDPQNVMFSWTPRHAASPNAAFNTEYEFTLVELYPDNRNPEDAIRAANSIFVTQTFLTSLNYSMAEPLLIPGRKYAFRVRAYDVGGRDLFKNNGYSEVHVFQFGDVCVPPVGIKAEALDEARIKVMWDQGEIQTGYGLEYRKKGAGSWEEQTLFANSVILPGLQGGTTYEYQVKGICGTLHGEFSNVATIETPAVAEDAFVCGAPMPDIELKTTPIPGGLRVGDIIKTADFEISLSEITANTDGSYKGFGFAIVPWFKMASARVKFSNIMVNEDYRVFSGNVTTIYNPNSQFVVDLNEAIEEMLPEGSSGETNTAGGTELNFVDTVFAGDIETITVNALGEIVIVDANGATTTITRQKDDSTPDDPDDFKETRITDNNGDTFLIDKNGTVRQGPSTAPAATVASADSVDFKVEFLANADQAYGFDKKSEPVLGTTYEQVTIQDEPYDVPWKAVALGGQDIIDAQAIGEANFPGTVGFKTETGPVPSQPAPTASQKQVVVTGKMPGEKEVISAVVTVEDSTGTSDMEVGRVNLITYNKLTQKLFIVPVNDAPVPDQASLVREINKVYSQAVAEWDITVDRVFNIDVSEVQGLDEEESGTFSSYNAKTKAFNKAFKNDRSFDKDAYYIFLIKGSGSSRSGFMPFKRQFGYVFADNSTDLITTIAHELGHGAFNLRHTFSSKAFYANERTTDNLMDYRGGKELRKYQWDYVHDPETMSGWFQDDEESAMEARVAELYDDVEEITTSPEFHEFYEKLKKILEFLRQCEDENWASHENTGIVPKCFWRDAVVSEGDHYDYEDRPFWAGVIDGGYIEGEAMYNLPETVRELCAAPGKVIAAYIKVKMDCSGEDQHLRLAELLKILERMKEREAELEGRDYGDGWLADAIEWLVTSDLQDAQEEDGETVVGLSEELEECDQAKATVDAVNEFFQLVVSWEQIVSLGTEIAAELKEYWEIIAVNDNLGRHERGRLVVPTITLLIPGAGEGSKFNRISGSLNKLKASSKAKIKEVAEAITKGADDVAIALKQFDVAGEFAKGKNVVEFSIEWGGQSYRLTWSKVNGKIDFGDRSQLARILGTSNDIEAHHLISWTKGGQHRVVQSAANDGFHLNMVENGLGLKKYTKLTGEGLHGNHPAYDDFLTYKLDEFAKGKSEFTARDANDFLQKQLIPEVKTHINNAGNTQLNLNEYFKQIVNKNTGVPGY